MSSPESELGEREKQKREERLVRKLKIITNEMRLAKQKRRVEEEHMDVMRKEQEAKERKRQRELKKRRFERRKQRRIAYELQRVEHEQQMELEKDRIRHERKEQEAQELLAEDLKLQQKDLEEIAESTKTKKGQKSKEGKSEKRGKVDKEVKLLKNSGKEKLGRKGTRKKLSVTSDQIHLPFQDPILQREIVKDHKNAVYFEEDYDYEYLNSADYFANWDLSSSLSSSENDDIDESALMLKYPFTYNSRQRNEYRRREEDGWQRHELGKTLRNKLQSLNTLKQSMKATKLTFCCHKEERQRREEQRKKRIENQLQTKYQIDVEKLPKNSNVVDKYLKYKAELKEAEEKQVERKIAIVEKLLKEEKRKHNAKNIAECVQAKPIKKPAAVAEIEVCSDAKIAEVSSPDAVDERDVEIETQSCGDDKKEEKKKKEKKSKEKSSGKKDKSSSRKSPRKEKSKSPSKKSPRQMKDKKAKKGGKSKEEKVSTPPLLPITRLRPGAENVVAELLDDFAMTDKIEDICREEIPTEPLVAETAFDWKPRIVEIVDFKPDHVVTTKVKVSNLRGKSTLWCRFKGIEYPDDFPEPSVLRVKHLLDVKKVCPGLGFVFNIVFEPTEVTSQFEAQIVFLTRRVGENSYRQFAIPVRCIQSVCGVKIIPGEVVFPAVPVWSHGKYGILLKKRLKIENSFPHSLTLSVKLQSVVHKLEEAAIDEVDKNEISVILQKIALSDIDEGANWEEFIAKTAICLSTIDDRIHSSSIRQRQRLMFRTVSRWAIPEPSWCTEDLHAKLMCREILGECVDNALQPFVLIPQYKVDVPANSVVELLLRFSVDKAGVFKDVLTFHFDAADDVVVEVPVSGEATPMPLRVEPNFVDLYVCIQDGDVYDRTIVVYNDAKLPCAVTPIVPRCLRAYLDIDPKEVFVQGHSHSTFRLRFMPGWRLPFDAAKYFNRNDDNHVKCNLKLKIRGVTLGDCPPLEVYFDANITSSYDLELTPAHIDFGRVSTLDTVKRELSLTNHTLVLQAYFLKTPPEFVTLAPGRIHPGQTIRLTLSYHPSPLNIEGNVLGAPGLEGHHRFVVQLTTAACMRGMYKGDAKKIVEDVLEERRLGQLSVNADEDMTQKLSVSGRGSEETDDSDSRHTTASQRSEISLEEACLRRHMEEIMTYGDVVVQNKDEVLSRVTTSMSVVKMSPSSLKNLLLDDDDNSIQTRSERLEDLRLLKTVVTCEALVYDPHCALSVAVLEFPPTPCGSKSVMRVRLHGENIITAIPCYCGLLDKEARRDFVASFAFVTTAKSVFFSPSRGRVRNGGYVDIDVVFRPEFPEFVVVHTAKELKLQAMRDQVNKKREEMESQAMKKIGSQRSTSPKILQEVQQKCRIAFPDLDLKVESIILEAGDNYPAEKSLLETMEPFSKTYTATCVVDTTMSDEDQPRRELHSLTLICPVVRPAFLLRLDSQRLQFGAVALGTRPSRNVFVVNISSSPIKVLTSTLNPAGPFFCPPQEDVWIEQEHILGVQVTYSPTSEEVVTEYLDITSGLTVSTLIVRGWGVVPQYSFTPDFTFYRFESKGNKVDCSVVIENQCDAPLPFLITLLFVKEAEVQPEVKEKNKDKKGGKVNKVKPKKMALDLPPEEKLALEEEFADFDSEWKSSIFTLVDVDGRNEVLVEAFQKRTFKVRFTPPGADLGKVDRKSRSKSKDEKRGKGKSSGGNKKGQSVSPEAEKKVGKNVSLRKGEHAKKYAAVFKVTLGAFVEVKQLVFMGSVKQKNGAKK